MLLQHFWKRWTTEYLPTLNRRSRWTIEKNIPDLGDVCLISEKNTPRPSWPLGKVIKQIRGSDGLVRTLQLITSKGIVTRPIQHLYLLEKGKV